MTFTTENDRIFCRQEGRVVAEVTFPQIRPGAVVIDHTWVDPSLRGQGAAGQLMQAVVDALRSDGRKAECAVQCQILSPGGSRAKRVQWTKQRRHGWRSAPVFASANRGAPRKSAKRKGARGKEFLSCAAGRNGFPLERGAFATR